MATTTLFSPPTSLLFSKSKHKPLFSQISPRHSFSLPNSHLPFPISLKPKPKHLPFIPPHSLPFSNLLPNLPSLNQKLHENLTKLTPIKLIKYTFILSLAIAILNRTTSLLLNPFFWTYFSFTWLFIPHFLFTIFTLYSMHCFHQHLTNNSTLFHQHVIVTAIISYLTIIPSFVFNGFVDGWPLSLFFVYHYFFFFEPTLRRRLYGDLEPVAHNPKWDPTLPTPFRYLFAITILIGHVLAAYEAPELQLNTRGFWGDAIIWGMVLVTIFARYHSLWYMGKYSERIWEPQQVVQFGPYRVVRHPGYAAVMMLFGVFCVAMRAWRSMGFMVGVCLVYYGRKAEMEERVMVEEFGERYLEYREKVRYRLIPYLY